MVNLYEQLPLEQRQEMADMVMRGLLEMIPAVVSGLDTLGQLTGDELVKGAAQEAVPPLAELLLTLNRWRVAPPLYAPRGAHLHGRTRGDVFEPEAPRSAYDKVGDEGVR